MSSEFADAAALLEWRLLDQQRADADQRASDADQLASDTDQLAANAESAGSAAEQERADQEQRASDEDQLAADRDRASRPSAADDAVGYEESRAERTAASASRNSAAQSRKIADRARTHDAVRRGFSSRQRDTTSEARDGRTGAREQAAAPEGSPAQQAVFGSSPLESSLNVADGEFAGPARSHALTILTEQGVEDLRGEAADLATIETALPGALRRGELRLVYQPLFDLESGAVTRAEALVRWTHPQLGEVLPSDFMPLAAFTGVIAPVGSWALQEALATLARWRLLAPDLDLSLAVNIAPEQLLLESFCDEVCGALEAADVPPSALTLEISERTIVDHQGAMGTAMDRLRAAGVELSIEDFGTGFAWLERLARGAVDEVKIGSGFVAAIGSDERRPSLAAGIIAMGAVLGVRVVAEGIQTESQRAALERMGCKLGQGDLFGPPVNAEGLDALLTHAQTRTSGRMIPR